MHLKKIQLFLNRSVLLKLYDWICIEKNYFLAYNTPDNTPFYFLDIRLQASACVVRTL